MTCCVSMFKQNNQLYLVILCFLYIDKVLTKCVNIESRLDKVENHICTNVDVISQTDVKHCIYYKKIGYLNAENSGIKMNKVNL